MCSKSLGDDSQAEKKKVGRINEKAIGERKRSSESAGDIMSKKTSVHLKRQGRKKEKRTRGIKKTKNGRGGGGPS